MGTGYRGSSVDEQRQRDGYRYSIERCDAMGDSKARKLTGEYCGLEEKEEEMCRDNVYGSITEE